MEPSPVAVAAPFPGSYALTCKAMTDLGHGMLSAECADVHGQMHGNTIQASACKGDIANMNGVLTCDGARATSAPIAASDAPAASDAASDTIALRR